MQDKNILIETFLDKFTRLQLHLGLKKGEMISRLGVSRAMFFNIQSGKNKPSDKLMYELDKIIREVGLSETDSTSQTSFLSKPHINNNAFERLLEKQTEQNEILSQALTQILKQTNTVQESQASYGKAQIEEAIAPLVKEIQSLRKECASLKQQQNQHPPPKDGKKLPDN